MGICPFDVQPTVSEVMKVTFHEAIVMDVIQRIKSICNLFSLGTNENEPSFTVGYFSLNSDVTSNYPKKKLDLIN